MSDGLVVRSAPRVAADSTMYAPLLPLGTGLQVVGGPVAGSGYTWYQVRPVSFVLRDFPGSGWVAAAGKGGEPWIGLPGSVAVAPGLAIASVARTKADPAQAKTAASSVNAFGLDLFRQLLADPSLTQKNTVFSPTSIALALGIALAGAKDETASQMNTVLHTSGWDALGPGLNSLGQALASRDATWEDYDGAQHWLALRIANAAYGQQGWTIEQPYLDAIAAAFGAGLNLVDFVSHPAAAIKAINAWVSGQTAGRIPQILDASRPEQYSATRLALVNALYLKAEWQRPFWEGATKPATFTRLDGSRVEVPMMTQEELLPYASGNGWQATELPYGRLEAADFTAPLAMTLILPEELATFEASLTANQLMRITTALAGQDEVLTHTKTCPGYNPLGCECFPYAVALHLPRFSASTRADLVPDLNALGMPLAFDPQRADFTGIHVPQSENDRLFVSKVIHQADIDVDEKGTEASAATVAHGSTGGGCGGLDFANTITLRLDHPFLFFVRDLDTGVVLFMGQVTDPSAAKGS